TSSPRKRIVSENSAKAAETSGHDARNCLARRHAATRRRANLGDPDQASGRAVAAILGCCGATVIESAASAWRQRLRQARWPTRGIRTARPHRLRFLLLNTVGKVLRMP